MKTNRGIGVMVHAFFTLTLGVDLPAPRLGCFSSEESIGYKSGWVSESLHVEKRPRLTILQPIHYRLICYGSQNPGIY